MTEDRLRIVVKETIKETLTALGFTPGDPQEVQRDMSFVRRMRLLAEAAGSKAVIIVIGLMTTAVVSGLVLLAEHHFRGQ